MNKKFKQLIKLNKQIYQRNLKLNKILKLKKK